MIDSDRSNRVYVDLSKLLSHAQIFFSKDWVIWKPIIQIVRVMLRSHDSQVGHTDNGSSTAQIFL